MASTSCGAMVVVVVVVVVVVSSLPTYKDYNKTVMISLLPR
jgi:hypothetical protein